MTEETYTVVLYARVSTDDKGQTTETQIREMREVCKRNNWIIADSGDAIYTDEQTAKNDKRPGFRMLKGRITEGDIDYVVARNQDRISREPKDYQNFLDFCKQYRVRVRYTDNGATPETADGVVQDSVQTGLAKADNIKRSSNTKSGMNTHKLEGKHMGRKMALCLTEQLSVVPERHKEFGITCAAMVQTKGDHKTGLLNIDALLDFARQGYSIREAAKILGVSHMTIHRRLADVGLTAKDWADPRSITLNQLSKEEKRKLHDSVTQGSESENGSEDDENVTQGSGNTRVEETLENCNTRVIE